MYCGCNKTALSSQRRIADAFLRLLNKEPYQKIGVSSICSEASVSRQTFYSLFDSRENIIAFILSNDYSYDPGSECECSGELTCDELSRGFSDYMIRKSDFILLLEKNNIIYLMQDCLYDSFRCFFKDSDMDMIALLDIDLAASCLTTIAKHYVKNRENITSSRLKEVIYDKMSPFF